MTPQIENAQPTGVISSSGPEPWAGDAPGPLIVTTGATTSSTDATSTAHASPWVPVRAAACVLRVVVAMPATLSSGTSTLVSG